MSNPWFKFFPSDWLAGTSGMTPAERGVYITLVCLIYEMEGPIVHDAGRLARRCGCNKASFNRALEALIDDGKLSLVDGKITNERAEKELSDRAIRSQKASITASKRWSAQGEKSEQKQRPENANASDKQCVDDAIPEARSQNIKDTNVSLSVSTDPPIPANDVSEAVAIYNHAAQRSGWPQVQKSTPTRSKQIKARLKECGGVDGWRVAIGKAEASDFICGRTSKQWGGFGFDWVIKPQNFTKLMEGNYDNRTHQPRTTSQGRKDGPDHALERIARLAGVEQAQGYGRG